MSERDDRLLLEDISDACRKITGWVNGLTYEEFLDDEKTLDAIIRNFEVIGEAANRLSDSIYQNNRNIKWRQIVGLRNRLIHGYFGVDYQIVWVIIQESLPVFSKEISEILENISGSGK